MTVTAKDGDKGINNAIQYQIISGMTSLLTIFWYDIIIITVIDTSALRSYTIRVSRPF